MNDVCLLCEHPWLQGQRIIAIGHVSKEGTGSIRLVHQACLLLEVSGVAVTNSTAEYYIARERV